MNNHSNRIKKILIVVIPIIIIIGILGLIKYKIIKPSNNKEIANSQQTTVGPNEESVKTSLTICYQYKNTTPDQTEEKNISITYSNNKLDKEPIKGSISGFQRNNEYSVGYTGTFTGTISNSESNSNVRKIEMVSDLVIADGGDITQEEVYELNQNKLTELRYAYKEDFSKNMLVVDYSIKNNGQGLSFPIKTQYQEVKCQ